MTDLKSLTLYVIRHGECEHNAAGRAAAQNDSPLTPRGRDHARANGVRLKEIAGDLSSFAFFASPLHRTCVTMELLRENAGLPPTGYLADRRLMEIDFGDHTWLTYNEIEASGHNRLDASQWDFIRPGGGESWQHVYDRVGRFLAGLTRNAVIVTHGGTARTIRAHYLGLNPDETLRHTLGHDGIMRLSAGTQTIFGA